MEQEFFKEYKKFFELIKNQILNQAYELHQAETFAFLLLHRFMIIYFIQEIDGVIKDKHVLKDYIKRHKKTNKNDNLYRYLLNKFSLIGDLAYLDLPLANTKSL